MPLDSIDQRRPSKLHQLAAAPPPDPEHLRCPRCDSTNTKFCYYNNYNFSQPRHFCKACRRYWTHGGTLRDIPVGGGSRKHAKRSRTIPRSGSGAAPDGFSSSAAHDFRHIPSSPASAFLFPMSGTAEHAPQMLNLCGAGAGSFTSLLNTQGPAVGLLALSGFGVGPGMDEFGYGGVGRAVWPFPGVTEGGAAVMGGGTTWQQLVGNGEISGDCFGFPDLAISTQQGNGSMK
ncbi:unnamed protein product [Cuscuta campestris]|uniref:Dof zinc finger protein n=1 Tax=Cuscuta campestris TaxID=132261 RepID=A0A484N4F7_9ASTE|nr:unnamed protein product [Cuscuta campestris]